MGTSNGGALGLYLTSTQPRVCALIAYSPAAALYDPSSVLLDKPWGLQIARAVIGSNYLENTRVNDSIRQYWSTKYRLEGLVSLQTFFNNTMNPETFSRIQCPVLLAYYYKNEEEQDKVVSVPAMLEIFVELATSPNWKRKMAFPKAGEHVIASHLRSKDWRSVEWETVRLMEEGMKLKPAGQKNSEEIQAPLHL
jgi:pimeloyl-ACP methyl ester carboxylesterase